MVHTDYLQYRFWQGNKMVYSGRMCDPFFSEFLEDWTQSHIADEADLMPIMQITFLKDSKGFPVYFGDIVEFSFYDKKSGDEYGGTALVVETMNGGAGIRHEWSEYLEECVAIDNGGATEDIWEDESLWTFTVVGNKYENSYLLMDKGRGLAPFKD